MNVGQKLIIDKKLFLKGLGIYLRKRVKVIGPTRGPDGEVEFRPISSTDEIIFDYVNELDPLKRFLTPSTEDLFRFSSNGRLKIEPAEKIDRQILFGIRSCDVQGILHMDRFFSGTYQDNYYLDRRRNTTIISMACNKALDTCFCICCDGGPWLENGFDLQLTDFGDRFLVEIGSEQGVDVVTKMNWKAVAATAADLEHRMELMQKCDEQMMPTAYLAKAVIQITNNRVKEDLWDEMGFECFSCGGCTHVCPLCTCFDVNDKMESPDCGVRFRCWDSCQYSGFTREASGHNPRAKVKERIKRRFYHKLSYPYILQDGHPGCVGCGRCITVCEAINLLDVPAVVKRIRRDGWMVSKVEPVAENKTEK